MRRRVGDYHDKNLARARTRNLMIQFRIPKQPCVCGKQKIEVHHPDYEDPFLVGFLCSKCHKARTTAAH
jgi:hypothetical protein